MSDRIMRVMLKDKKKERGDLEEEESVLEKFMTPSDELFFSSPIQDTGNSIALPISLLLIPVRSLLSKCKNDQIYLAARLAENYTDTLIQLLSLLKEASFCYRC